MTNIWDHIDDVARQAHRDSMDRLEEMRLESALLEQFREENDFRPPAQCAHEWATYDHFLRIGRRWPPQSSNEG